MLITFLLCDLLIQESQKVFAYHTYYKKKKRNSKSDWEKKKKKKRKKFEEKSARRYFLQPNFATCAFDWTEHKMAKTSSRGWRRESWKAIQTSVSEEGVSRVSKEGDEGWWETGFWYFSYFRYHSSSKAAANTVTQGAPSCLITNGS